MADHCESCGNDDEDDRIYYCRDCRTYFCDACLGDEVGQFARLNAGAIYLSLCPECSDGGYLI
jgi:hypothetical protein